MNALCHTWIQPRCTTKFVDTTNQDPSSHLETFPTPQSISHMSSDPPKFIIYGFRPPKVYYICFPTPQSISYISSNSSKFIIYGFRLLKVYFIDPSSHLRLSRSWHLSLTVTSLHAIARVSHVSQSMSLQKSLIAKESYRSGKKDLYIRKRAQY